MTSHYSSAEKIVYFVRHGRSEDNMSPVFQSPDSPLDEIGRAQADKIADRISRLSFDCLIASPFQRAKETAQAIAARTGKGLEYSELFVERVKPTSINGKPHTDTVANALWREWERCLYTPGVRAEDGENFDDIIRRAGQALDFLADRPEKLIVVVSHGFFVRTVFAKALLGEFLNPDTFRRFQRLASMENTGLSALRYQASAEEGPAWHLWIYNDHAHLG